MLPVCDIEVNFEAVLNVNVHIHKRLHYYDSNCQIYLSFHWEFDWCNNKEGKKIYFYLIKIKTKQAFWKYTDVFNLQLYNHL